ncbi:DUF5906 domain-containing protein [Pusillimonas sp. ANT_WB101]|uniref:DUF5906 domain-containing protein n=1 Tax=Pusillimonas sp. ANT_WB101 TaxID=2597356 RepID=UPI0011ECDDE6|nr:DUF5906 domain-containing protein [Pusillimonas sp. ANT_WB101]KAA0889933.1 hypothetical protein FQ179_16380 [Pusillimonas sp. ANT_WB101]
MTAQKATPTGQVGATGTSTAHEASIVKLSDTTSTPPPVLVPILSKIPETLKRHPRRWCVWLAVWKRDRNKYDKLPKSVFSPLTSRTLSVSSEAGWGTFDQAVAGHDIFSLVESGGLGFKMTGVQGLVGIDLDHCVDADGEIRPWAQEVIDRAQSYTELSPSGKGLHIFVKATTEADWVNNAQGIEVYGGSGARFLTVTGHRISGTADDINRAPVGFLDWLKQTYRHTGKAAPTIDADMPDLLSVESLPSIQDLRRAPGVSDDVLVFLDEGTTPDQWDGDRSNWLQRIARELTTAVGGDRQKVCSIIHHNPYAWDMALDKRGGDEQRALDFVWRHNCLKVRLDTIMTGDEFEDVTPNAEEVAQRAEQERSALDAKRRAHQKRENEIIGEGHYRFPIAEEITLESAKERFVFISEGSMVVDIFSPQFVLKLPDWKNTYAASTEELPGEPGKPPKVVPVTQRWYTSKLRKRAVTRTFKAGDGLILLDPDGKLAVNSWRPFDRTVQVADVQVAGVGLFLEHVHFLFGGDTPRFLDWLAHIEQCPGVLPHTSWLHIATNFGMGRNWLASVLARVWAGSVATNLDLVDMFVKGFNERLSRKVLAVVDEIREGGRDSQWEHSEKLKSTITEEVRRINPKYGHVSMEFNACRWLLFSNHLSAIPLENGDRRVEVVTTDALPKDPAYYTRLYRALESPQFIAAIAAFLGKRDISGFNPGAHARNTEAKKAATKASQTPMAEACQLLVDHWPADFITAAHLYDVLTGGRGDGSLTAAHRRSLEQAGIHPWGKPVKIDGRATRVSVVRNRAQWLANGTPDDLRKELEKVKIDVLGATTYEYLLGLIADT